jgi:NADPH:quinone reductase-like Zn-dependent oxidoreductase
VKAVVRDFWGAAGHALVDLPEPGRPGPSEILVAMSLAPVNPADRMVAAGRYAPLDGLPDVIGAEGMGVIEAIGYGVVDLAVGDRVILMSRGNWVSRRVVPAGDVLRVPPGLPDAQAAMLRINPATAFRLLSPLGLGRGDWLIQNAAGSSVARWVRLLAERRGVRVLNVVRSGTLDDAGAVLVDGEDLQERAMQVTGGAPVMAALDAVAGEATGRLASCLEPGGTLLVFGHLSGRPCAIPSEILTTRGLRVAGFSLRPAEAGELPGARAAHYAGLAAIAIEAPEPVRAVFALSDVDAALAAVADPGRRGRLLLALDA